MRRWFWLEYYKGTDNERDKMHATFINAHMLIREGKETYFLEECSQSITMQTVTTITCVLPLD